MVVAGPGTTVDGSGSQANPYIVSAQVTCDQVRPCLSAGPGATYDPATGVIGANVSGDAGNNLTLNPDGSLYVPTDSATVTTGCGLTGDGSGGAPLTVATGTWPYPCPPDANGGVIVCGSDGVLRGEPRGRVSFYSYQEVRDYPDLPVPAGQDQPGASFATSVTNPDPCREALVFMEREADVDFILPAGAGAAYGHGSDETFYTRNSGTSTIQDVHAQTTKVFALTALLAPGATLPLTFDVTLGRGTNGATYNRIQIFIRALLISL